MAQIAADLVMETASAPGTSTVSLGGAIQGYRSFYTTLGSGAICAYKIADNNGNWEIGLGTVGGTSGLPTLARTTPTEGSTTTPINFTSQVTVQLVARVADLLMSFNNLSDLANAASARANIGLAALGQSNIPMLMAPSGTMGNNGAVTLGTALPATYASAYVYFPSGAISSGSAAGIYYTVFSSTTVGTVYNNTYTSSTPTIPASPTAFFTTGPGSYTQTVNTAITLFQTTVPANTLGINDTILQDTLFSTINNSNTKTAGAAIGSFSSLAQGLTTVASARSLYKISNRGVLNSQISNNINFGSVGVATSTGTIAVATVNFAVSQTISINVKIATATDYLILESAYFSLVKGV